MELKSKNYSQAFDEPSYTENHSTSVATPSCGFSHFSALLQNCSLPGAGRSTPDFAKRPPLRTDISGRSLITVIMALQEVSICTQKLEFQHLRSTIPTKMAICSVSRHSNITVDFGLSFHCDVFGRSRQVHGKAGRLLVYLLSFET